MEKRPNDTIETLRAEFANVRKTAIVGHIHPDGDCISSCLALYHYLKDNYGYEVDVYLEPYPSVFDMLPDTAVIRHTVKPKVYDVVYSLDCADLDRIGTFTRNLRSKTSCQNCIRDQRYSLIAR